MPQSLANQKFQEGDVIDEEFYDFRNKQGIDIKKIIFAHINRISEYMFKGSTDGEIKEDKKGNVSKSVDKRETIIEAIKYLIGIMQPHYDEDMKKAQEEIYKQLEKEEDRIITSSIDRQALERARMFHHDDPELAKESYEYYLQKLKDNEIYLYDKESPEHEYYLSMKYNLMFKIFEELNYLLERQDYLEGKGYEE